MLDPVGCGATPYRTRACLDMLRCGPAVVRGNGSEIIALSGAEGEAQDQAADAELHGMGVRLGKSRMRKAGNLQGVLAC